MDDFASRWGVESAPAGGWERTPQGVWPDRGTRGKLWPRAERRRTLPMWRPRQQPATETLGSRPARWCASHSCGRRWRRTSGSRSGLRGQGALGDNDSGEPDANSVSVGVSSCFAGETSRQRQTSVGATCTMPTMIGMVALKQQFGSKTGSLLVYDQVNWHLHKLFWAPGAAAGRGRSCGPPVSRNVAYPTS